MRALPQSFAEYRWAPSTEEIARTFGLDPLAGRALRRQRPCTAGAVRATGSDRGRARRGEQPTRTAASRRSSTGSRDTRGSAPRTSSSARAPTTSSCSARGRSPGPATSSRSPRSRRIRSTASAAQLAGAEIGDDDPVRHVLLPAEQPDRRARRAPVGAPARRRRGVLRVLGRDRRRPHRRRRRRHPDVLEVVRARGRARRLRARGRGDRGRAEPAPGAAADLGHLGRARAPRR